MNEVHPLPFIRQGTAEAAAENVADAATEAAQATEETAEAAAEAVAEEATDETTIEPAEPVEAATEEVNVTAEDENMAELFTVDGFDFDRVTTLIDESQINDLQKTVLKGALDQARNNPDLLREALDRVKEALNL